MVNTVRKQDSVWKSHPKYLFIEANQFGDIRIKDRYVPSKNGSKRLVKGHILKQYDYGHGYMYVSFKLKGKKVHLSVHRIVATCFIPNPNDYPEVNHIDCNRANNPVSNLEWRTKSYNRQYREKYEDAWGRPVFAVNLETYEVLYFKSQKEAGLKLDIDPSDVTKVVNGKLNTVGGFWFTENESEITEEKYEKLRPICHSGVV